MQLTSDEFDQASRCVAAVLRRSNLGLYGSRRVAALNEEASRMILPKQDSKNMHHPATSAYSEAGGLAIAVGLLSIPGLRP